MAEELLLTPEEMEIAVNKWKNEDWATRYVSLNRGHYEDILPVIAEAQLAKAKPIIEKQERERIFREIESKLIYISLEIPSGTPSLHLQSNNYRAAEVWQALKEGK